MQKEVQLVTKEPFRYVVIGDKSTEGITEEILLYESIVAPVEKEEELGAIIYKIEEEEIGRIPLVSKEEIVKSNYMDYIKELLKLLT